MVEDWLFDWWIDGWGKVGCLIGGWMGGGRLGV